MIKNFQTLLVVAFSVFVVSATVGTASAANADKLDRRVGEALEELYSKSESAKELARSAEGILVFPSVKKGGFVLGGEFGRGAMIMNGRTEQYYSVTSATGGLQLGYQARAQVFMFLTSKALSKFQNSDGWEVGVDGSVAVITLGAEGSADTNTGKSAVVGYVFDQTGLMYNLTLEGTKFNKICIRHRKSGKRDLVKCK